MTDPKHSAVNAAHGASNSPRESWLRARFERLRLLRSAWGALAPSGLSGEKQAIAETGRALSDELTELLAAEPSDRDRAAVAALDADLDALECEMRGIALKVPVVQLRSTLPGRVAVDRRGLLDLLDLLLGAELAGLDGTGDRIPVLDYLITLLCTGGKPGAPLQDPVTLTPRIHGLCERSQVDYDSRLPELEAEFYAAADMHEAEIREELAARTLRRRKQELGSSFFAPRVLRAIVTYNAALLQRIDEEVSSSQDWGAPSTAEATEADASVFATSALPQLAGALRRRAAGDPPAHDPVDRIAWCLDLAYLSGAERGSLLDGSTGRRENFQGTAILVGLLCRSAVVLDEEFPAIGISPDRLTGAWLEELGDALQLEVNQRLAGDDYVGACALSDLKGKFLGAQIGVRKARTPRSPPSLGAPMQTGLGRDARKQARQMTSEALESLPGKQAGAGWRNPWRRITAVVTGAVLAVVTLTLVGRLVWDGGRFDRAELAQLSPFLTSGRRSAAGGGPAFVGTLEDVWSKLDATERVEAAEDLVEALREQGVRDVMIYDDARHLRIQALGEQAPRVLPASYVP